MKKIDKSVKKHTYIEEIVMQNTKKKYPKPGPNDHFLDEKTAGKYHSQNPELFINKVKNQKFKSKLP